MTAILNLKHQSLKDQPKPSSTAFPSVAQSPQYLQAEQNFIQLLNTKNLDQYIQDHPEEIHPLETAIATAITTTYSNSSSPETDSAHLFLQRILYYINRLNLFWYDDLTHYQNERSYSLQKIRDRIESAWQTWELSQLDINALKAEDVKQGLQERYELDLDPIVNPNKHYLREEMTFEGYRYLLAIASLDGLVEASRLSRILGGASNEIQSTLIRVLLEEYGNGRFNRKHSTFYAKMMAELGLDTQPEGYFDIVPWELLASINHNFLLTECKQYFLRYNGGLTYFEIFGPSIYTDYMKAAQRLNLSDTAMGYWELHIREDERHGKWMLDEVAVPLAELYPYQAWEILLGYDQEKFIGDRAGSAIIKLIKQL